MLTPSRELRKVKSLPCISRHGFLSRTVSRHGFSYGAAFQRLCPLIVLPEERMTLIPVINGHKCITTVQKLPQNMVREMFG